MPKQNKKLQHQQGMTLIELILYIGIISIFIGGVVMFSWDIIYGRVKSQVQLEVNQNLRFSTKRINKEIRAATGINSVSGNTISLQHNDPNKNPTVFNVSSGQLRIGQGNTGSCPTSSPCPITSDQVQVSNLSFSDLSTTDTSNIQYTITIDYLNPEGKQEWERSETFSTSVELRTSN